MKATYGWFNFATQATYGDTYNRNAAGDDDLPLERPQRQPGLRRRRVRDVRHGDRARQPSATNPDLKQPKTHEVTASLERQIAANFSARASYVYRREVDRYQNVNVLRPYDAYIIAIPNTDPGPTASLGTSDDGGALTYYDYTAAYAGAAFVKNVDLNTPGYENSYHNIEVAAQKRLSNKWQLVTSFLATHVDMWRNGIPAGPERRSSSTRSPSTGSGASSWPAATTCRGRSRRPAMFTSQSGSRLGARRAFHDGSGPASAVILLMEDPAANRLPTQNMLNFRFEKRQKLGPGTASFQFDLFNVTNTNVELGVTTRSGASFSQITSIVPPRVVEAGRQLHF